MIAPLRLTAGKSFGPYSILGPLGAGGMGEVYRARDPRLGRDVAVKIISGGAAGHPERQVRFEREARAASALNHPNILTVHDVGREGDTSYIVCELVEGESLRELLRRGPLPLKDLLAYATQIADGLAAAHEAGIVHRDIKPENVMVTRGGLVKILDFGLAKVLEDEGLASEAETLSERWSRTGRVFGTAPYMSPEQAAGGTVDLSSDQFSFGVTLYEMAAGRRPFDRETAAQTLAAIIAEEPEPLASVNPRIPAPLRWVVERCLAKKPGERYAATADLHRDLRTLRDRLAEATPASTGAVAPVRPLRGRVAWAAGTLALVALAAFAGKLLSRHESGRPYDMGSFRFTPFATDNTVESFPEWSPDGKSLAYVRRVRGQDQVFVQGLSSALGTQVTSLAGGCTAPFWAPDGHRVYCISRQVPGPPALYSVGAAGGASTLVLEGVRHASISPDGKVLAFVPDKARGQVWLSSPPGAEPKEFFGTGEPMAHAALRFSPDGAKIALRRRTPDWAFAIWVVDFPGGTGRKVHLLREADSGGRLSWLPDSRRIVGGSEAYGVGGLWILDTSDGRSSPLTVGLGAAHAGPSVSPDGSRVAFAVTRTDLDLVDVPLDGSALRALLATSRQEGSPSWAPGGNQLAYATDREGPRGIWLFNPSDETTRPLVTARDFDFKVTLFDSPRFSPDGQRIVYQVQGPPGGFWISRVAGGAPVPVLPAAPGDSPTWSPDGEWIAYQHNDTVRRALVKVAVGGSTGPQELAELAPVWQHPQWSPKGDWISCLTAEGLTLVSPDGKQRRVLLAGTGLNPHGWSRDAATIYGLQEDSRRHTIVARIDVASSRLTTLGDLGPAATYFGFSLSPDGRSFTTTLSRDLSDIWILDGLRDPGASPP
jgi:Tol biopolymer transport system component